MEKGGGRGQSFFFFFNFYSCIFSFQYLYNTKWQNLQIPSRCVCLIVPFAVCLDMNERLSPSLAGVTCSSLALNTGNWGLVVTNEKDTKKHTHHSNTRWRQTKYFSWQGNSWLVQLRGQGMVRETSCSGEGVGQLWLVRWGSCGKVIGHFGGER